MGLFDWLSGPVIRRAQASTTFQTVNNVLPVYPDAKLPTYINAYTSNAAFFSIVSLAARKFSVIPWYVYNIMDEKKTKEYKNIHKKRHQPGFLSKADKLLTKAYQEIDEGSAFAKLISRPNNYQGQDTFLFAIYAYYLICGEAFIWLNRGDVEGKDEKTIAQMPVLEMFVLPSQYMEVIPDQEDVYGVTGYRLQKNGTEYVTYSKAEIIHWKTFNPCWESGIARTHLRGFAPLSAGLKILTQDEDATDAAVAQYKNGGVKAIITNKSLNKLTPTQASQLDDVIDEKINNNKRKAAVAALQGDWAVHQLGNTSVDMELLRAQDQTLIRLCNLMGVPSELFLNGSTYANKLQARKDLVTNLIIPACCSLRDEMNRALKPAFKAKANQTVDIDYSEIAELQEDLSLMVQGLVNAWWFTPNQRLKMMNEEESEDENMNKVYIPSTLQPLDNANMDAEAMDLTNQNLNDYTREDRESNLAKVS